jgi:hypothetical protein
MQSVVKLSDVGNIYKLSDHTNADQDASSDHSDGIQKKPAAAVLGNKDGGAFGNSESLVVSDEKSAAEKPAVDSQSGADDALAWLKIIQNATGELTADLHASKGDDFGDETSSFEHTPSSRNLGPVRRREGFNEESRHEDYENERQLAQKLSYRYAEPPQAPPQTLGAAVLPYVAATGVLAFLAGSAAVYFLMGSSSADVKARAVAPAPETQIEAPLVHVEQPVPRKGSFQRAVASGVSSDSATVSGSKAGELGARPAESGASVEHQPQKWSDTVETFKQFVKPEQK